MKVPLGKVVFTLTLLGLGHDKSASLDVQQIPESSCFVPVLSTGLAPNKTFSIICQLSLRGGEALLSIILLLMFDDW